MSYDSPESGHDGPTSLTALLNQPESYFAEVDCLLEKVQNWLIQLQEQWEILPPEEKQDMFWLIVDVASEILKSMNQDRDNGEQQPSHSLLPDEIRHDMRGTLAGFYTPLWTYAQNWNLPSIGEESKKAAPRKALPYVQKLRAMMMNVSKDYKDRGGVDESSSF